MRLQSAVRMLIACLQAAAILLHVSLPNKLLNAAMCSVRRNVVRERLIAVREAALVWMGTVKRCMSDDPGELLQRLTMKGLPRGEMHGVKMFHLVNL